jgi:hypothetical protein
MIIIFLVLLIIIYIYLKRENINYKILPFGYQYTPVIKSADKDIYFNLLNKYGTNKDKEITNKILSINHSYPPTWGIKIDRNNNIEFEMYFYVYHPNTRQFEENTITLDKLKDKFNFNCNNKPQFTMYSIDYQDEKLVPNFYYFTSSDNIKDVGYSEKEGNLNNHYYRYFPNTIDNKFNKYIDTELINYNIKNIKTVFIADKLIRNYYGIYYDGITFKQLKYFIKKYNFDLDIINNFNETVNYSISVDFDKKTNIVTRIGIYGLLY